MTDLVHVLNRGVDKRKIFMDDKDYLRFIHDLFEFNDKQKVRDSSYHFNIHSVRQNEMSHTERQSRKLLVDIHAFCLMPNHYHLLLSPRIENGVSLFMKKLNGGFAQYFNQRHERTGALFERRYKSVAINSQSHFIHLPYYIHLNPLDMFAPEWRDGELKDYKGSVKFLDSYRWSSHLDYLGEKNFPSLTSRDFLLEIFGGKKGYKKKINDYLKDLNLARMRGFMLE